MQDAAATERTKDRRTYIPRVDIYEDDQNNLRILADMPGANEKSVSITLEQDVLTIEASVDNVEFSGHTLSYAEYGVGDYYRAFTLSEKIDREKIEARMKNGVLSILLPKAEPHKTRKIKIQAG
ncbi:MAG: Hsp20/alpha crystallin family protein [Deltaproteobacteria bacterium]|nr:Hsp20/alpha crystallin family protein [Deltaproteobacteria bacterium]